MESHVGIKFYLYGDLKSASSLPIYMRIIHNRKKAELYTGYTCTKRDWNDKDQTTKFNHLVNQELLNKKSAVYAYLVELKKDNKPITAAALKDLLTGKARVEVRTLDYLQNHIEEIVIRGQIKPISLNKYRQSLNSLIEFIPQKYGLPDLPIDQVNYEFINAYDLFLKQTYHLHKNTINKYHSRFRTLLLRALAEGIITKQPYANFKLITVKSDREFLGQDDLNKIGLADLSHNLSLDKVRDIFIFSCYTGLRFQDAQNLTTSNLTMHKNKPFLRYAQEKTGLAVDIPLLPAAKKIIDKYKNAPERIVLTKLLPKISNQKVNTYLKLVSDLAGIQKNLTHHMARHTFATTICLNNGMPMEDVSRLLGHSSIKTTQVYGRITQDRLQKSMEKIRKKI